MDMIQQAALNFLAVLITAMVGVMTKRVTQYLKDKGVVATLQAKETSVLIAVDAIEQIARNEKVPDKFKSAKRMAIEFLNEQGISVSDAELEALIESAVAEINKSVKEVIE
ncbi:MAG: phage holin, LLH family [Vagococcus sp.]